MAAETGAGSPWQRSFADVEALPFRPADERISYGDADEQFVDLWLPPGSRGGAVPVVVLIHGGCWMSQYGIGHVRPMASALADRGFAVWAVEYRRIGQEGGGWPGTFDDIAAATDLLGAAERPELDTGRTVLVGHSAGGHLALWAAGRSRLESSEALYRARPFIPAGAIGLAAITDLAEYANGDSSCQQATLQLMGGSVHEAPGRYAQASPAELGVDIPLVLVHGDRDTIVPFSQATALADARLVTLAGAGHFDLIHTDTPAFSELLALLEEAVAP